MRVGVRCSRLCPVCPLLLGCAINLSYTSLAAYGLERNVLRVDELEQMSQRPTGNVRYLERIQILGSW